MTQKENLFRTSADTINNSEQTDTEAFRSFFRFWRKCNGLETGTGSANTDLLSIRAVDKSSWGFMTDQVFLHGMKLLRKRMPAISEQCGKLLCDEVDIERHRSELAEIRKTGDISKISNKELEIADCVQERVSKYPYKSGENIPVSMIESKSLNCVGASMLGGALLDRAGLNYLVADVPKHSTLMILTADGQVELRDMLNPMGKLTLTDEQIKGRSTDGSRLKISDITAFSQNPSTRGLEVEIEDAYFYQIEDKYKSTQNRSVLLLGPGYGQKIQFLANLGYELLLGNHYAEAEVAFSLALEHRPKLARLHSGIGRVFSSLAENTIYDVEKQNQINRAISAYIRSVAIDPKLMFSYYALGESLSSAGHYDKAVKYFQKFVGLADDNAKKIYKFWLTQAQNQIEELSNKGCAANAS